ncbi:uncharacterized protein [Sagmatias obliquidens]|uniref:uncharacterized protein n=1 Tax=Sagmatias obliquidens TaxID=3371155 RepID=UPI000F4444FD|nr:uncharacterized protein LOC113628221 [Lagenorhynchus obliquidens]
MRISNEIKRFAEDTNLKHTREEGAPRPRAPPGAAAVRSQRRRPEAGGRLRETRTCRPRLRESQGARPGSDGRCSPGAPYLLRAAVAAGGALGPAQAAPAEVRRLLPRPPRRTISSLRTRHRRGGRKTHESGSPAPAPARSPAAGRGRGRRGGAGRGRSARGARTRWTLCKRRLLIGCDRGARLRFEDRLASSAPSLVEPTIHHPSLTSADLEMRSFLIKPLGN